MIKVRAYRDVDRAEWSRMREALWPGSDAASYDDTEQWLRTPGTAVLVASRSGAETLAGFVEIGPRPYADGCDTSPVAFLEAWYVDPDTRRKGVGTALLRAAEDWAREHGFDELASDTLLANLGGQQAHTSVGFEEVERSVKYRKLL